MLVMLVEHLVQNLVQPKSLTSEGAQDLVILGVDDCQITHGAR